RLSARPKYGGAQTASQPKLRIWEKVHRHCRTPKQQPSSRSWHRISLAALFFRNAFTGRYDENSND
ncbi:MAG: hypothetical protein ABI478_04355, partial [Propionivibrio sp.]